MIAPLYGRRIIPYPYHSVNSLLFFVVNLALTATIIQIVLGHGPGAGSFPALAAITCAIALTWLGIRAAASMAWVALMVVCVISTVVNNYAWGLAGFGFVASGFAGILLQTELNPGVLISEIISEYTTEARIPNLD